MFKHGVYLNQVTTIVAMSFLFIIINLVQFPILNSKHNFRYAAVDQNDTYDIYESLLYANGFKRKYNLYYALRDAALGAEIFVPTGTEYVVSGGHDRFLLAGMAEIKELQEYSNLSVFQDEILSFSLDKYLIDKGTTWKEANNRSVYHTDVPSIRWSIYALDNEINEIILIVDKNSKEYKFIDARLLTTTPEIFP